MSESTLRFDFERRCARGEVVMWVRARGTAGRLLVFAAGHFDGDLGEPRLNQRAALYAEAMLEKAPDKRPTSAIDLWQQLGEVPLTEAWTPQRAQVWWLEHLPSLTILPASSGDSSGELKVVQ